MAIKPKTATLQVRLSESLLARLHAFCDAHEVTASEFVRSHIAYRVADWEKAVEKGTARFKPEQIAAEVGRPFRSGAFADDQQTISGREVGGMKRKERRELEKQARKAGGKGS